MQSDADAKPPRELTPAFYGCYDWHSSVHGHWLLVRLVRLFPDADFAAPARAALAESLTEQNIQAEVEYLRGPGRVSFERPYGLAWLLKLAQEIKTWDDPQAKEWARALAPLEVESAQRFAAWLPKLNYPIRSRRAQPDGLRLRTAAGLGRRIRRCRNCAAARRPRAHLLPGGPQLPAGLRTVRRGLPVALPRRGRLHAAHAAARPSLQSGCPASCRGYRRTAAATGWRPASSRTAAIPSSRTSTVST